MHWIVIGILIWIGLAIAPTVIGLVLVSIPFAIGALIGGLIGAWVTKDPSGMVIGALIGGILPYVIFNKMVD